MKSCDVGSWSRWILAILFCLALQGRGAAQSITAFGLTNNPIGSAVLSMSAGELFVYDYGPEAAAAVFPTRPTGIPLSMEGAYGVSVQLGQADAGVFVYPYTYGEPPQGGFLVAKAVGQLDGQENQLISVLAAFKQDYGIYWANVDFSSIGSFLLRYELHSRGRIVAATTNGPAGILIITQSEYAPRGNPFWRMPDGGVAAVIDFSGTWTVELPGLQSDPEVPESFVSGDRIVVRPLDSQGEVGRISRVDVTAGGPMSGFYVTDERVGAFRHAHRALGQSVFNASADALTVSSSGPGPGSEFGVLVDLDEPRAFSVDLAPVDLSSNGASIVASAVAGFELSQDVQHSIEFLGYIGVRQANGAREVFGDFSLFDRGVSLGVYRDGCQAGTTDLPSWTPTVGVAGAPQVTGFAANADMGNRRPGLSVRFGSVTTFTMPDGSTMTGDELRFRATGPVSVDRLEGFSLLGSKLPAVTIVGESGADDISFGEYLPELAPAASIKLFSGALDGAARFFRQAATSTQRGGVPFVALSDTLPAAVSRTSLFAWREEALWFHGADSAALGLFSDGGLRLLPAQPTLGQIYASVGSFVWHNSASGTDTPVQVTATSRVADFEPVETPAGRFYALRLETSLVFEPSTEESAPRSWYTTNWLAAGVGIVALAETEELADGSLRQREGKVVSYNVIKPAPLAPVVNVGANTVLSVSVASEDSFIPIQWFHNGQLLEESLGSELILSQVTPTNAGLYSVVSSNTAGEVFALAATLRVTPFPETTGFRAWHGFCSGNVAYEFTAGDHDGNIYYAGALRGTLDFGAQPVSDTGEDRILFVVKFDPSGNVLWSRTADGPGNETLMSFAVDAEGDVYLYGNYQAQVSFGTSTLSSPRGPGAFAAKLSADGVWRWAVQPVAETGAFGYRSGVDAAGNQLITGTFKDAIQIGTNRLVQLPGESSFYFAKLNRDGQVLWAAKASMPGEFVNLNIDDAQPDGTGGFYVSGLFTDALKLGGLQLTLGTNGWQGFLARLDGNGNGLWLKTFGLGVEIATIDSGGLYALGYFRGNLNLGGVILTGTADRWGQDRFLARLQPDGSAAWGRKLPAFYYDSEPGLVADSNGNAYFASSGFGNIRFGETTFSSGGEYSTVLTKYNPQGQRVWSKGITGAGGPFVSTMGRDGLGNVILSGSFHAAVNFGATNFVATPGFNPLLVTMRPAVPPTLTQQPQSSVVNPGDSMNFTAVASGTAPLEFQWRRNGADVEGATSATLTIPSAQPGDAGVYTVVVRNSGGLAFSLPAVLRVNLPDAGTLAFSATNFTASESGNAVITLVRSGDTSRPATVTVETVDGSAKAGLDYPPLTALLTFLPGESTKTLQIPIFQNELYEPAETLQLRLCNPGGGATLGVPAIATVTINDDDSAAPVILAQPRNRTVGEGGTVSFSVTANGEAPLQFEWRKGGVPLSGANSPTLTLSPAHMADAGVYSVRVHNGAGEATSIAVSLTVLPPPRILVHPQSQSVPYGDPVTFSVTATSSVPVVLQPFGRIGSGPDRDTFQIPNTIRRGIIEIRTDFGNEADSLTVLVGRVVAFTTGVTTDKTTNFIAFDYSYPPPIEIVVNSEEGAGADPWSYQGQVVSEPLRYQWRLDGQDLGFVFSPHYVIPMVTSLHRGAYDVVVSDAVGSVTSSAATLTVTPPVLRVLKVTDNPPQLMLWWTSPDHFAEHTTQLPNGTWESLAVPWTGTIVDATNRQDYFRLRSTLLPEVK